MILSLLNQSELSVGDLARFTGLSISSVSQHLTKLKSYGIVDKRRESQKQIYHLDPDMNLFDKIESLLNEVIPNNN